MIPFQPCVLLLWIFEVVFYDVISKYIHRGRETFDPLWE